MDLSRTTLGPGRAKAISASPSERCLAVKRPDRSNLALGRKAAASPVSPVFVRVLATGRRPGSFHIKSSPRPICSSSSQGLLCPVSTPAQPMLCKPPDEGQSLQLGQPKIFALKLMQPRSTSAVIGIDQPTLYLGQSMDLRPVFKTAQRSFVWIR